MENKNYTISYGFLRKLMMDHNIQELLDFCSSYLKNPVLLFGHANNIIGFSSDIDIEGNIPFALSFTAGQLDRAQWEESLLNDFKELRNSDEPVYAEDGFCFQGHGRLSVRMQYQGKYLGILALIELNGPVKDEDREYIQIISRLIAEKLFNGQVIKNDHTFNAQQSLTAIAEGHASVRLDWAEHLLGANPKCYVVTVYDADSITESSGDKLMLYISRLIHRMVAVKHGSEIIVLTSIYNFENFFQIKSVLADASDLFDMIGGMSHFFKDLSEIHTYYQQARDVKNYYVDKKTKPGIYEFSKNIGEVMLGALKETTDLSRYLCMPFKQLARYDRKNNTEYTKTLLIYLRCGKNRSDTCRYLNVHKNTLAYRLEKISECTGCSFDDGNFIFSVMLSDCILRADPVLAKQYADVCPKGNPL